MSNIGPTGGVPCPECDGPSGVTDSRKSGEGVVRRRRRCATCGHRWTTYEVPSDWFRQEASARGARIALTDAITRLTAARDALDATEYEDPSDAP